MTDRAGKGETVLHDLRSGKKRCPGVRFRSAWASRSLLTITLTVSVFLSKSSAQESATINPATQNSPSGFHGETTEEYNRRLEELLRSSGINAHASTDDYRIGPEDLLEISVFEAPELGCSVRVAANGEISLPLVGSSQAAGLSSRELEIVIQELLRRTYMKDPHVGVFVKEMQSHSVSVFGAVKRPGVFQIRGSKRLIEVLSMAEGLSQDAGDTVVVMRQAHPPVKVEAMAEDDSASEKTANDGQVRTTGGGPAIGETLTINLKDLLNSANDHSNVVVYPGDVIKVPPAGVVYVLGEVKKPGGFLLKTNENVTVLQAVSLAEGVTRTSARGRIRIIRTDGITGARTETPINLDKILAGKAADPILLPKDIVFVPNSTGRSVLYRGAEVAVATGSGLAVYRW